MITLTQVFFALVLAPLLLIVFALSAAMLAD